MLISDAVNILGLNGEITPDLVKQAYREAAKKYHPDINPAGAEMMKVVNAAFDVLKNYNGNVEAEENKYPEALNNALLAIMPLIDLSIEVCGAWVWVTGDTFKHKTILKENGFKYASKKQAWHFRPENWKSRSRGRTTMDDIRNKYGSTNPTTSFRKTITSGGAK